MAAVGLVASRSASRGGWIAERGQRSSGEDCLPGVPGQGLANGEWADGGDVPDADGAVEGFGDALGWRQRRGHHGLGSSVAERPMGSVLAKSIAANGITTPGSFVRPK